MEAQAALHLFMTSVKEKVPPNHAKVLLYLSINPGAFQKTMVVDGLMSACVLSMCMQTLISKGCVIQGGTYLNKTHTLGEKGEAIVKKLLSHEPT